MLTFESQIPHSDRTVCISVLNHDMNGWIGNIGFGWQQFEWGIIHDMPWISVGFDGNGIRFSRHKPVWYSDWVSEYAIGDDQCLFVLMLSDRHLVFETLLELTNYVMLNVESENNFGSEEVEYGEVSLIFTTSKLIVDLRYTLHNDVLFSEQVRCDIGWVSAHAKRDLRGQTIDLSDRKLRTYWSVEYHGTPEDPVNAIMDRLFKDRDTSDLVELDCFDQVWCSQPDFIEPSTDFTYRYAIINKWKAWSYHNEGETERVYIGMLLNAPIIVLRHAYYAFPSPGLLDSLLRYNSQMSTEIYDAILELYSEYQTKINTYRP
jgi:hypothetical protein